MSKVKLTLPGLEIPVTGKQVTFSAPCDCSSVECLQIDGVDYTIVDAMGNEVIGAGGVWAKDAKVSVILDCENKKAYIQNGNPSPSLIGAVKKSGDTMTGILDIALDDKSTARFFASGGVTYLRNQTANGYGEFKFNAYNAYFGNGADTYTVLHTGNLTTLGAAKIATGSYTGTGTTGQSNPNSITFTSVPKCVLIYGSIGNNSVCVGRWFNGVDKLIYEEYYQSGNASLSVSCPTATLKNKTLSWYATSDAYSNSQLNVSGCEYRYIAILE